jgi:hypothetical protein
MAIGRGHMELGYGFAFGEVPSADGVTPPCRFLLLVSVSDAKAVCQMGWAGLSRKMISLQK